MLKSKIEWTHSSWNPLTGCSKISSGCKNCYAEKFAIRLQAMGNPRYKQGFQLTLHPETLSVPLRWKNPRLIFVNSMSDLFHESVPPSFIKEVFKVMATAKQHIFQILTKRSHLLLEMSESLPWPNNVWMGVSVESQDYLYRIDQLRHTKAAIKFISCEPLLGPIDTLNLNNINWVIVGGESGPGARPMKEEWATTIRDRCLSTNTPFFFKQWGGTRKKAAGRILAGKYWNQMPNTPCDICHNHLI